MRFYEDPSTIYLDSAKAGPMYFELLDWRNKYEKNSLIKKSQIRESHKDDVIKVEKNLSKFFNVKTGDVFFSNSFSRGFHSLVSQFKGEPSFLVLENDYPSISEAIIKNNFNIIYVKNDLYVEENIKIAVEKYQPDFLVISVIQWIDGIKIDLNFLKKLKSNNNEISAKFDSRLNPATYLWIIITNAIIVPITLGLMSPWAQIRFYKYLSYSTKIEIIGDLNIFLDTENKNLSSLGEEYSEMEGIEVNI